MKIYTEEEVRRETLKYFNNDTLATDIWMVKYALKNEKEEFLELTPDDMHKRLAEEFARIESKYDNPMSFDDIYCLLKGFKYCSPQGSPLSGIGNSYKFQSLSNCFILNSPFDSYAGILTTDQEMVHIYRRRGGVGFDISTLRPAGALTTNAGKKSDGIIPFSRRWSNTTREVGQGGRRGALMLCCSCHHPQILDFINIKRNKRENTGANLSVKWTDEFLNALKKGEKVQLRFPVEKEGEHIFEKWVDAKEIWDVYIDAIHCSSEPGAMFWDTITKRTPSEAYHKTIACNPCGEIPSSADSVCNLFVINGKAFVQNPFTESAYFDFELFAKIVKKCQRLIDDQCDLELEKIDRILSKIYSDPEPERVKTVELNLWERIKTNILETRRTGLGLTGVGDLLACLNIKYDSKQAIEMVGNIYKVLCINAYLSSCELAKERGSFAIYDFEKDKKSEFLQQLFAEDPRLLELHQKYGRRNIALLTTAPVGSLSQEFQVTTGIEPLIYKEHKRRRKISEGESAEVVFVDDMGDSWTEYIVLHKGVKEWKEITGREDIENSPYVEAGKIDYLAGVEIQAAAQKWVCHAISRTCNLPKSVTKEEINDIYINAWERGLKGITVYVEGTRDSVLSKLEDEVELKESCPPKRPETLPCEIHRVSIRDEKWTIFVGLYDDKPYEVFAGLSNYIEIPKRLEKGFIQKRKWKTKPSRYDLYFEEDEIIIKDIVKLFANSNYEVLTRLISLSLRHGARCSFLVEQLSCDTDSDFSSFSKVMARVLKKYIKNGEEVHGKEKTCKECGSVLTYNEGCVNCVSCGFSKCS
jgi:ribonucleoside-diphosphate reductase alpha chain